MLHNKCFNFKFTIINTTCLIFTVVLVFLAFNERYSLATYATLLPISLGFSLAAGGDPGFEQTVRSRPHPAAPS